MELSYYPLTMEALDQADAEALCLFVSEDERPLTGLAGLVDWRLSGRLSRMIRAGLVIGAAGEALLTPPGMRLAFTYQGDALKKRVEPLAHEVGGLLAGHCDVTEEASMNAVFAAIEANWAWLRNAECRP